MKRIYQYSLIGPYGGPSYPDFENEEDRWVDPIGGNFFILDESMGHTVAELENNEVVITEVVDQETLLEFIESGISRSSLYGMETYGLPSITDRLAELGISRDELIDELIADIQNRLNE